MTRDRASSMTAVCIWPVTLTAAMSAGPMPAMDRSRSMPSMAAARHRSASCSAHSGWGVARSYEPDVADTATPLGSRRVSLQELVPTSMPRTWFTTGARHRGRRPPGRSRPC